MTTAKTIICRCEDVTEADVRAALHLGFTDLESLKRYAGFGTGPCQGKGCLSAVRALVRETAEAGEPTTQRLRTRPPAVPVALGALAGKEEG